MQVIFNKLIEINPENISFFKTWRYKINTSLAQKSQIPTHLVEVPYTRNVILPGFPQVLPSVRDHNYKYR